ncbi:hypothetical protein [Polynucleobacter arcticus]|uniref:hypothetical protein n=1 Tax=Polynucleobacter arcticus TaxID=1743165 RepID=UPI00156D6C24|nr:hypothetical protein [Polynucleobacter arcticus]
MRHFFQHHLGSTFRILLISLVIAISAIELLSVALNHIESQSPTQGIAALTSKAAS